LLGVINIIDYQFYIFKLIDFDAREFQQNT